MQSTCSHSGIRSESRASCCVVCSDRPRELSDVKWMSRRILNISTSWSHARALLWRRCSACKDGAARRGRPLTSARNEPRGAGHASKTPGRQILPRSADFPTFTLQHSHPITTWTVCEEPCPKSSSHHRMFRLRDSV